METTSRSAGNCRLVIGVGNAYRRDDGVGLAVARRLLERAIPGLTVRTLEREASGLLDSWVGMAQVVVIDAAHSGAPPGTVHRFHAGTTPLPAELFRGSTHSFGVAQAVELARALGKLPATLIVYGIAAEEFEPGVGLTAAVEAVVEEVAERVLQEFCGTHSRPKGNR